jgi:hypothetical protein
VPKNAESEEKRGNPREGGAGSRILFGGKNGMDDNRRRPCRVLRSGNTMEDSMTVQRTLRLALAVFLGLSMTTGFAWANGEEFFGLTDGKLDMYYFGHIKDGDGKVLDNAVVTVVAKNLNLKFPFRNDAPGHFRSPDIGKAIKGLGKTVDPSQIEIQVVKKGYVLAAPIKVPNKVEGGIGPLELVLVPAPASGTK